MEYGSIHYCEANEAAGCHMKTRFALLKTKFMPAIVAVGLLVTSPLARSEGEATVPTDSEPRLLTFEQLHNGQYHLPLLGDEDTPIRFDGAGTGKARNEVVR